jgi:acetyl-CoA carboxylase biotin carboxylase subunit
VEATKYENAGTVEFLMDENKSFYFLEMNTRLQVEHPVTEAVTGLDLVQEQLLVAAGEKLRLSQEQVRMRGWAMECRIYAEDPKHNFRPSPGLIQELVEPQGPGVRVDSGVYQGWEVSIHYDPLIAKLVTFGADRAQAIARMKRALREYQIHGIETNLSFFVNLLSDPEFLAGRLSTNFIEEFTQRERTAGAAVSDCPAAALVAAALAYTDKAEVPKQYRFAETRSAWRLSSRPGAWKLRRN